MTICVLYTALWAAALVCPTIGLAESTPLVFGPAPVLLGERITDKAFQPPEPQYRTVEQPAIRVLTWGFAKSLFRHAD